MNFEAFFLNTVTFNNKAKFSSYYLSYYCYYEILINICMHYGVMLVIQTIVQYCFLTPFLLIQLSVLETSLYIIRYSQLLTNGIILCSHETFSRNAI